VSVCHTLLTLPFCPDKHSFQRDYVSRFQIGIEKFDPEKHVKDNIQMENFDTQPGHYLSLE
jgi:hypothetical protein